MTLFLVYLYFVYEADPAIDPHLVELEGYIEILLRSG